MLVTFFLKIRYDYAFITQNAKNKHKILNKISSKNYKLNSK